MAAIPPAGINQEIGNRQGEANALSGLAEIAGLRGNYDTADTHYNNALTINQEIGNRHGEAHALSGLMRIAEHHGRSEDALSLAIRARSIYNDLGINPTWLDNLVLNLRERLAEPIHE